MIYTLILKASFFLHQSFTGGIECGEWKRRGAESARDLDRSDFIMIFVSVPAAGILAAASDEIREGVTKSRGLKSRLRFRGLLLLLENQDSI
jgi:hypothetical protein